MAADRLMRAALSLAGKGMSVFPLHPGTKRPAVQRNWERCATTDVEQIERWWHRAPYNIGVATGPSQLVVVDLDVPHDPSVGRHGRLTFADLARDAGGEFPRGTFTVATPSGGQHLYFRAPVAPSLTNTAGRLGPLIDTRASGGYIVGPGSRIERRFYRIVTDVEPARMPDWLFTALRPVLLPQPSSVAPVAHPKYVDAALRNEARRVAAATPGRRNIVLFQAAAKLGRFVRSGQISSGDIIAPLTAAATKHIGEDGFTTNEIDRTIRSGLRRGTGQVRPGSDVGTTDAPSPRTAGRPSGSSAQ